MGTIIRDIDFGPIWDASGVRSFFGEGYKHYRILQLLGLTFEGVTFVAKATTLERRYPDDCDPRYRAGNLRLDRETYQPVEWFPECIKYDFLRNQSWRAEGFTGPGARSLFDRGQWQEHPKPFWISFVPVARTRAERLQEAKDFCAIAKSHVVALAPMGIQIDLACINQNDLHIFDKEIGDFLTIFQILNVPLMIKISIAATPVDIAIAIGEHPACDGLCISSPVFVGWHTIDWWRACDTKHCSYETGTYESPLKKFGGGSFSGPQVLPLAVNYIAAMREHGFEKHINGGNGIRRKRDVDLFFDAGADSVFVATGAITRPWRMKSIIDRAYARK